MTKEKNQAELIIESLDEVFGIATIKFEEFHKACKEKSKGTDSTAASSGENSKAASSAGVRNFVEQTGKSLDDTYTAKQIAKLVAGQFGAEKFAQKING